MKKYIEIKAKKFFNDLLNRISDQYEEREARANVFYLLQYKLNLHKPSIMANQLLSVDEAAIDEIHRGIERMIQYEPVQYITGHTEFYGLPLKVNPSVLIPRPETEELVELICKENRNRSLKILDIGTGSGCIALALKANIPDAEVLAVDVSTEALKTAKENARINNLDVTFLQADILKDEISDFEFDIWVSNPPYIRNSEKAFMLPNVLQYEPKQALFVDDHNPLVFYKTILRKSKNHVKKNGKIYFEINEALGNELLLLLEEEGYVEGRIVQDINEKDRMIAAIKK